MKTPILDFIRSYAARGALRLHMPGHKGHGALGVETFDITEIDGADSLYEANGIIAESEGNASRLFGSATYYSTEGSSQCIRAMLYLALKYAGKDGRGLILAGRNAHKSFLSAAILLDFDIQWLTGKAGSYLSCAVDGETLSAAIENAPEKPVAVYLTSPDYLSNVLDIEALSAVCKRHGVLLLVDNAHGAYLKFLPKSLHPIDLGADMCADSAHKTLPVLTGGAYLHVSEKLSFSKDEVKNALALFGSTSPSYLTLASLDCANAVLETDFPESICAFLPKLAACKARLEAHGFRFHGSEPLKLTLHAKAYGYSGGALAALLEKEGIVSEFADPDFVTFMLSPSIGETGLKSLERALFSLPKKPFDETMPPAFILPERVYTPREAAFLKKERIETANSLGRVLASVTVACPPAVPIVVCGERMDGNALRLFEYYGIAECEVVQEK
ncbi:MAG: PLP-dependent transferase [Clostridia bacterium]|nr:PLP-dependent transferase [Clostridia bacterium]